MHLMRTASTAARRITVGLALAITAGVVLAGCTSQKDGDESVLPSTSGEKLAGSYEELLHHYLDQEENPFVIEVLNEAIATGGITLAQYDQAHRMYTECMVNAGYQEEHTRLASGIIQITPPEMTAEKAQKYVKVAEDCAGELATIEALYRAQQGNPELLSNGDEIVVACFKRKQIVDAQYTTEDLANDLEQRFKDAPYDPQHVATQECFSAGGYAVAFSEE